MTMESGDDTRSSQIIREGIHSGSQTSRIRSGGPVTSLRLGRGNMHLVVVLLMVGHYFSGPSYAAVAAALDASRDVIMGDSFLIPPC